MFKRVTSLFKVTAVRLSIIYTLIFGILAIGIVFYMTGATVNVLREQYQASIDEEVTGLARIYRQGGINSLVRTLDRRARAPGANLYVITNPQGEIIAGNVPSMQNRIMSKIGWTKRAFKYERFDDDSDKEHRAIARILEVPNGMRILVGRDVSEYEGVREIVRRGFNLALGTMVALGLLTWLPVTGTNDEFDRLSENLNHMLDQINHLDDGVKQMSDNIAHDLKTPITRLRNKAEEAFSLESKPQEQQEKIADIIDDCDSIVKTFDALLMISRVESGSTVAKLECLNALDILNDVYELYEALVEDEGKQLKLSLNFADSLQIMGNRELLSQAISNLIDNAVKYGGETITLAADMHEKDLSIMIIDSGEGIAEEDRNRVIERFVRLDKSRNMSGNGLGLSLVKAISKMHKGSFKLADNYQGFSAVLTIPYLEQ